MVFRTIIHYTCLFLTAFVISASPLCAQEKPVLALKTVVIDAGHGGNDPGAVCNGVREKDINLDVAVRFGSMIKSAYPGVKVIYTRSKDVYVPLSERSSLANKNKADLFVSIHVNSVKNGSSARGTETFLMGTDKSGRNMDVCKLENSVILLEDDYSTKYAGYDPDSPDSFIFFNLMQTAQFEQSVLMASLVEKELAGGPVAHSRGIKQAPLLVLWQTTMPSVLVEMGFISNSSDREKLQDKKCRAEIAGCLFNAFVKFKEQYEVGGEKAPVDMSVLNADAESVAAPVATPVEEAVKPEKLPQKKNKVPAGKTVSSGKDEGKTSELGKAGFRNKWRVQIMVASKYFKPNSAVFKGVKNDCVMIGELYYYFTGKFDTRADAVESLPEIREQFPGSFIVEFDDNGNPIK